MSWDEESVKEYNVIGEIPNAGKILVVYDALEQISKMNVIRCGYDNVEELACCALESFLDKDEVYMKVNDKEFIEKITYQKIVTLLTALEVIVNGDPISVELDQINDLAQLAIDYFNS